MALAAHSSAPSTLWASSYLAIPYLDRGDTRKGCDCLGLVRLIHLEQLGVALPAYDEIPAGASFAKARAMIGAAAGSDWQRIQPGDEQPFDIVLMKGVIQHEKASHMVPVHIACVTKPGRLIHMEERGVSIPSYRGNPDVTPRVLGFYRWRGA